MIPFHSLSSAILLLLFCTDARHRLISHAQTHTTMSRGKCLDQPKFCSGATIKASGAIPCWVKPCSTAPGASGNCAAILSN